MPDSTSLQEKLSTLMAAKPFVPLAIVMADGRRFEITERLQIAFNQSMLLLISKSGGMEHLTWADVRGFDVHEKAFKRNNESDIADAARHQEIRSLLLRRPFFPFTLEIKGGVTHEITESHHAAVNRFVVVIWLPGDSQATYRLNRIQSVRSHEPAN